MRLRPYRIVALLALAACGGAEPTTHLPFTGHRVRVAPNAVDFGAVRVGETASRIVTLQNVVNATTEVIVSCDRVCEALPERIVLAPREQREVELEYGPRESGEVLVDTVRFECANVAGCFAEVEASGRADRSGRLFVTTDAVDFGTVAVGLDEVRGVVLTNVGDGPLDVDVRILGESAFRFVGDVPTTIAEPRLVNLGFEPTRAGPFTGQLEITAGEMRHTVALRGVGLGAEGCALELVPESLSFGIVEFGRAVSRSLEFHNLGGAPCHVALNTTGDAWSAEASSDVLPANGSIVASIRWNGVCHAGCADECDSTLEYAVNGEAAGTLALSAPRVDATLLVVPTAIDFGSVCRDDPRARAVAIYNTGCSDARIAPITAPTLAPFSVVAPAVESTIGPGEHLDFDVRFLPPIAESFESAITIERVDTGVEHIVSLRGERLADSDCP